MEGQRQRPGPKLSGHDYRDERISCSSVVCCKNLSICPSKLIFLSYFFVKMHATTKILRKNCPTPIRGFLFLAVKSACVMQDKAV